MANCVPTCLFVCLAISFVHAQVGSICRPNERLLPCGCPKTCRDPVPNCEGVCKMGCFCEEGQVRNDTGHCVDLADCLPVASTIKQETSEPRIHENCPENEEYRFCEPCLRTCANPNPICPAQCSRGCFCKGQLLRDKDGKCVPFHDCSHFLDYMNKSEKPTIKQNTSKPRLHDECPDNEEYRFCEPCLRTCENPTPICPAPCSTGCFCKENLLRDKDGKCVPFHECSNFMDYMNRRALSTIKQDTPKPELYDDCPANEEFRLCEPCFRTCENPYPICPAQCSKGCFCKGNLLRDKDGSCVPLHGCSNFMDFVKMETSTTKQDTSEPPIHENCPDNEEYRFCESCPRTCANPNPMCPAAPCMKGCFCKGPLLRDKDGKCVPFHVCSNFLEYIDKREKNYVDPVPYRFSCGPNQVYKECEKCTRSCSDAHPVCGTDCKGGCFCKDGLVKGPDGKCMPIEECPTATSLSFPSPRSVEVEDCTSAEEYYSCGWCEPTCREPNPSCPEGCTSGCLCRPPLLRHASGKCVTEDQCEPKDCSTNEEYVCRIGCETTCASARVPCVSLTRRCTLGCYCKLGYLRDEHGRCVTFDMCLDDNYSTPQIVVED